MVINRGKRLGGILQNQLVGLKTFKHHTRLKLNNDVRKSAKPLQYLSYASFVRVYNFKCKCFLANNSK